MSATTVVFLAIGCFAIVLLVLSVFGGYLHLDASHLDGPHLDGPHLGGGPASGGASAGGAPAGGAATGGGGPSAGADSGGFQLSLPAIAGFLGAFGFGGAIASVPLAGHGALTTLAAALIGLAAAVPMAWLAGRLVHAAMTMRTDRTPDSGDLLGATGVVVTPVPSGGDYGEVRIMIAGAPMKLNARADRPLDLGTRIFVVEVSSPTSVVVEAVPGIASLEPTEEGRQ